jgi:hypothetical protein
MVMSNVVAELFGRILVSRLVGSGLGKTENLLDFVGVKNVGAQQTLGQTIPGNHVDLAGLVTAINSLRGRRGTHGGSPVWLVSRCPHF